MARFFRAAGHGEPAGDTRERADASALLPPIALAIVVLASSIPASASSSGAKSAGPMTVADALYFDLYGPNPYVQDPGHGNYRWVISHTQALLGPVGNESAYHNSVGFITLNSQDNRRLAYQIKESGSSSNPNYYTYTVPYSSYSPNTWIAAWLQRNPNSSSWRFHWWGPGFYTWLDANNNMGANDMQLAVLGADTYGGCTIRYDPYNPFKGWRWHHKTDGYWAYLGGVINFSLGNAPTWGQVGGNAANGGYMYIGTQQDPQTGNCY